MYPPLTDLLPKREKTHGEWLVETLAYYAERGIALPPVQVMLMQLPRKPRPCC